MHSGCSRRDRKSVIYKCTEWCADWLKSFEFLRSYFNYMDWGDKTISFSVN